MYDQIRDETMTPEQGEKPGFVIKPTDDSRYVLYDTISDERRLIAPFDKIESAKDVAHLIVFG